MIKVGEPRLAHFEVLQPKDNDVFLDVGAYEGTISKEASNHAKNLKFILVEPNPVMHKAIAMNLQGEDLTLFPVAAGQIDNADAFLYSSAVGGKGGSLNINHPLRTISNWPVTASYQIKVHTLDTLLQQAGDVYPDFVKIDVEGFILQVLEGLTHYKSGTKFHLEWHWNLPALLLQLLKKRIEPLMIELWDEFNGQTGAIHGVAI